MTSIYRFAIPFAFLILFFTVEPAVGTARKLTALVQQQPLVLKYHNGALLKGKITVNLIWYGQFTPIQRSIIVDFIQSLNSPQAPLPSASSWWKTIDMYKGGSSTLVVGKQILHEDYTLGKSLKNSHLVALANKVNQLDAINIVLTAKADLIDRLSTRRNFERMDLNDQIHLPGPLKQFDCSANEIISFKLIRSEEDLENEQNDFAPEFTHQIFGENERIFGYKNLQIDLFCLSSSLHFYLNIQFDEKINPKKYQQFQADDLQEKLKEWIPSSTTTNVDEFVSKLKEEKNVRPFGEEIFRYQTKKTEKKASQFAVYRVKEQLSDNEEFVRWYSRLETFLVFFIDAASPIDKEDPNWTIYLLYQQFTNANNDVCFAPVGFITVYQYYAYPDKIRPRISQVLILPPYQRQGHGRKLLSTVLNDLRLDPKVRDITAEDPSDEFVALRDLVTFELCQKHLSEIFSKENILQTDKCTKDIAEKTRQTLKLTKEQTRRVYEMSLLHGINRHDDEQLRRYRLLVKKRLFEPLQFDKRRRLQLSDPALEALATDPEKRKKYLSGQFEIVDEHYSNILRAFDKYQEKSN